MLSQHFTDGRWLWYFDEAKARHGINAITPEGAFCKPHLNTFEADDGTKSVALEEFYNRNLESPTAPVLRSILSSIRTGAAPHIDHTQRGYLQHFIFLQFKRPPDAHEELIPDEKFDSYFAKLQAKLEYDPNSFSDEDRALFANPRFREIERKNLRMRAVAQPSEAVFNVLSRMGLYYLIPERGMFVIGSCPVLRFGGDADTGDLSDFVLIMPIASDAAVAFGPMEMNGVTTVTTKTRWLNERIVRQSSAVGAAAPGILKSLLRPRKLKVQPAPCSVLR